MKGWLQLRAVYAVMAFLIWFVCFPAEARSLQSKDQRELQSLEFTPNLSPTSTRGCPASTVQWKSYVAQDFGFKIDYPANTQPYQSAEKAPGLLSWMGFEFNQPFEVGTDRGSIRFTIEISVWSNPKLLSTEAWAKQVTDARVVSQGKSQHFAGSDGYVLRESNMVTTRVRRFTRHADRIFDLTYTDIVTGDTLITTDTAKCWTSVFDRMIASFAIR